MTIFKKLPLLLFLIVILSGCVSTSASNNSKPVILIAAFGSSYESGLKNLEDMDSAYTNAFPDHDVYWSFTASFIVNKLRRNGINSIFERETPLLTVEEAYDMFRNEGRSKVVVQILMVMNGSEMREVIDTPTDGLNVKYGYPLLHSTNDIGRVAEALSTQYGNCNNTYTILAAHGNDNHMIYNAELVEFDNYLIEHFANTRLGTIEGAPLFSNLQNNVIESNTSNVKFVPLMLTYGDHISNDVMGDNVDSWRRIIGKPAECSDGMASNLEIQEIFVKKTEIILKQF